MDYEYRPIIRNFSKWARSKSGTAFRNDGESLRDFARRVDEGGAPGASLARAAASRWLRDKGLWLALLVALAPSLAGAKKVPEKCGEARRAAYAACASTSSVACRAAEALLRACRAAAGCPEDRYEGSWKGPDGVFHDTKCTGPKHTALPVCTAEQLRACRAECTCAEQAQQDVPLWSCWSCVEICATRRGCTLRGRAHGACGDPLLNENKPLTGPHLPRKPAPPPPDCKKVRADCGRACKDALSPATCTPACVREFGCEP